MLLCNRATIESQKLLFKKKSLELNNSKIAHLHNRSKEYAESDEVVELGLTIEAAKSIDWHDKASKDLSPKQSASRSRQRHIGVSILPSMSSLNLIFNKACLIRGQQAYC